MRKILTGTLFMALAATLAASAPGQDHGNGQDHGRHNGWYKHGDGNGGNGHDNGQHRGWDNPRNPHYNGWNYEGERFRPGHPYPYGRYNHVREAFAARRFDYRSRRIVLFDNSNWVVAPYDLDRCRDWDWDRDRVFVYDDDHHPGWYLLFNARLGRYVHVEYFGLR